MFELVDASYDDDFCDYSSYEDKALSFIERKKKEQNKSSRKLSSKSALALKKNSNRNKRKNNHHVDGLFFESQYIDNTDIKRLAKNASNIEECEEEKIETNYNNKPSKSRFSVPFSNKEIKRSCLWSELEFELFKDEVKNRIRRQEEEVIEYKRTISLLYNKIAQLNNKTAEVQSNLKKKKEDSKVISLSAKLCKYLYNQSDYEEEVEENRRLKAAYSKEKEEQRRLIMSIKEKAAALQMLE